MTDIKLNVNEKYINLTLDAFNGPIGETLVNVTSDTFVDVLKLYASISLSLPKTDSDKNEVFKATLDLCKIQNGIRGNFIVSMILEHFNSSADYSMQCPMKAGVLHMYNFQITDSFLPTYLLMSNVKFIIDYQAKAKIPNVKNLVYWYSMKLTGEIKK